MFDDFVVAIVVAILVLISIFIVCREFMCWYYKINKIVGLMEEQNYLLRQLPAIDDWDCKKCGSSNRKANLFCFNCGEKKNPDKVEAEGIADASGYTEG
jgi:hypothetical protein